MPRHDNNSTYIAHGFVDDCDALMEKCSQFGRLNYEKFCDAWKEMQFVQIFHGRKSSAEIAELSEEVIHIAKYYMLNKNNNTEETVAGLFLVYALQNLQPYSGFAALRITPDDVPMVEQITKEARRERRCDVLFILGSVLIKGPVHYQAAERERGMELSYRKYLEGTTNVKELSMRRRGVFSRYSDEMDLIKECNTITRLYSETKSVITGTSKADRSLSYVNHDLASELEASFKKLITGSLNDEDKQSDEDDEEDISTIKQRAMKNTVDPMKHLTGVQERKELAKKSPDKKKGDKGKAKTNVSPTKSPTKNSRKKRKTPPKRISKRRRLRKSVIKHESDEDDDDDDYLCLSSNDEDEKEDKDFDSLEKELENRTEQQFDIEIDALPVLFTTEMEGKIFEIEVIDELKRDVEANTDATDVNEKPGEPSKAVSNVNSNDTEVFKVPLTDKVKRLERRELKQPILKSKFKRMGVLPVTNFKN